MVLNNVKITSIDLDSPGRQFTEFTSYQSYTFASTTNLQAVNMGSGVTRFRPSSATPTSNSNIAADRVQVAFNQVSTYTAVFGNEEKQAGYFGVYFSGICDQPVGSGSCTAGTAQNNPTNSPPTSTSITRNVASGVVTTLVLADFGNYSDPDSNPFAKVKITTLPDLAKGTIEYFNGNGWQTVTLNQEILTTDIDLNKLRYTGSVDNSLQFKVYDGLVYSTSAYTLTLTVSTNPQTITFNNPGTKSVGPAFASGATASSGLVVTLTSTTTSICTVSGLNITPVANGTCTIVATQTGNATYGAAAPVQQQFNISSLSSQTITFADPGNQSYSGSNIVITSGATASSGLTVTLTSYTPLVCTISGLNITVISTGSCQVRATQAGNGTYAPASPVEWIFLVSSGGGALAPSATTQSASSITETTASINGVIKDNGASTTVTFCWGTSNTLASCSTVSATPGTVNSNIDTAVSYDLSGLAASTTYYFRVIGTNSVSTTNGSILSFTTSAAPVATVAANTDNATSIGVTSATLNGTIDPVNLSTSVTFCWGTDPALADCSSSTVNAAQSPVSGPSAVAVTYNLTGLTGGTDYYYFVKATNSGGTDIGSILSFTTAPTPTTTVVTTTTATPVSVAATTTTVVSTSTTVAPSTTVQSATTTTLALGAASQSNGSVTGTVWIDLNKNNIHDPKEPFLPGVTVKLTSGSSVVSTAVTDKEGAYLFTVASTGTFAVVATVSSSLGLTKSWDSSGGAEWNVPVIVRVASITNANFAATAAGATSGEVTSSTARIVPAKSTVECIWSGVDEELGTPDDVTFTATVNADGTYELTSIPAGRFSCAAVDAKSGVKTAARTVQVNAVVKAAAGAASPTAILHFDANLPQTGINVSLLSLWAWALVVTGTALAVTGRRRRRTA